MCGCCCASLEGEMVKGARRGQVYDGSGDGKGTRVWCNWLEIIWWRKHHRLGELRNLQDIKDHWRT